MVTDYAISGLRSYITIFCCVIFSQAYAQQEELPEATLKVGAIAPPLVLSKWFKGTPVTSFEKGKYYVIEFWATWCAPCRSSMPRLSKLAKRYRNKLTVIGVDVLEFNKSVDQVQSFVDSMGKKMRYRVAADHNDFMKKNWGDASGGLRMPDAFIIDKAGTLVWFGHPTYLPEVLPSILANKWDVQEEIKERTVNERLRKMDDSLYFELLRFGASNNPFDNYGKPDSALLFIESITRNEPGLKYAPKVGIATFEALLRLNPADALEFGRQMLAAETFDRTGYERIALTLSNDLTRPFVTPAIYGLGADVLQKYIDWIPYPENINLPAQYTDMALYYDRAKDKRKAISAHRKAIKAYKKLRR